MSEGCKIILAGKIKMLKNTQTCMHKRVHTQEYIFLHPHTHNFKHKHNWIFFSYTTFTLKLTLLCSVFRPSCIASGCKFLPPVCFFFFLPFHFVDVIITYLSAPENYKVNNGQHQCQYCVFLHCNFVPFAKYTNPAQIEQYLRANAANGIMQWWNSWLIWKGSLKLQTEEASPDCLHGGNYRWCCLACCETQVCCETFYHGKLSEFTEFVWKNF